jgi:capsule biosynthesis phosphatase
MPDRVTGKKLLVIDLDGTLTTDGEGRNYYEADPNLEMIDKVNSLWLSGDWHVTIFTARGMQEFRGDVKRIEAKYRIPTESWLSRYKVCYDKLLFGKPSADMYVDDKNRSIDDFIQADL